MRTSLILLFAAAFLSGQPPLETAPMRTGMSWKYKVDYTYYAGAQGYRPQSTGTRDLRIDSVSEGGLRIAWVTVRDSGSELYPGGLGNFDQETHYRFIEDSLGFRMELLEGPPPLLGWLPGYFYKAPIRSPDAPIPVRIKDQTLEMFRLEAGGIYVCARSVGAIRLYEYSRRLRPGPGGGYFDQVLIEHNGESFDFKEALEQFDSARAGSNKIPWEPIAIFPSDSLFVEDWDNALGLTGNRLVFSGPYVNYSAALKPAHDAKVPAWEPFKETGGPITSLAFNDTRLFASSPSGIFVSDDAGKNWRSSYGGCPEARLNAFGDLILAFTHNHICSSGDGGGTWKILRPPDYAPPYYRYPAAYSDSILRISYFGYIEETRDLGATWKRTPMWNPGQLNIRGALAFNSSLLIAGFNSCLGISRDAGLTWRNELTTGAVYSTILIGDTIVAGTDSGAYLSPDQGKTWINISKGLARDGRAGAVVSLYYKSGILYCATREAAFRIPFRKMFQSLDGAVRLPSFRLGRRGSVLMVQSLVEAARLEIRDLRGKLLVASEIPSGGGPVAFPGLPGTTLIVTGLRADGARAGSSVIPGGLR